MERAAINRSLTEDNMTDSKNASTELKNTYSDHNDSSIEAVRAEEQRRPWWHSVKEAGSAAQIVIAAALAIAIGLAVTSTVKDIPDAAPAILGIPGDLWLRSLKAVVLPLIITAMILAVQKLKEMTKGGAVLARWTIGLYVGTTLIAIIHSTIMVSQVWSRLMVAASSDSLAVSEEDKELYADRESTVIHEVVVQMFESLIPDNVVNALAENSLLAVLVTSVVVGYLIEGPNSSLLRAVKEIERIITIIIAFLIKLAPIGVFFLILPNLFKLNISEIGQNLGVLIGGALTGMAIHLIIVLPLLYFVVVRKNPTHIGSNARLLGSLLGARGIPDAVAKLSIPLGCLINMDGTAIYFPVVVVFMAETQGKSLGPADYVIICLLSTLASIGTTPIPSSSLVLTVMIANSVNVPLTGMYAVVVAIDWFLDRFRTAVNVSGDLYVAPIVTKLTGITGKTDEEVVEEVQEADQDRSMRGEDRV